MYQSALYYLATAVLPALASSCLLQILQLDSQFFYTAVSEVPAQVPTSQGSIYVIIVIVNKHHCEDVASASAWGLVR